MQRSHLAPHIKVIQGHYYPVWLQLQNKLELGKEGNLLSLGEPCLCHTGQRPCLCASKHRKMLFLTAGQWLQQQWGSGHRGRQRRKMGTRDCLREHPQGWPLSGPAPLRPKPPSVPTNPMSGLYQQESKDLEKNESVLCYLQQKREKEMLKLKTWSNPSRKTPS